MSVLVNDGNVIVPVPDVILNIRILSIDVVIAGEKLNVTFELDPVLSEAAAIAAVDEYGKRLKFTVLLTPTDGGATYCRIFGAVVIAAYTV